jgi:hypothetical protein
MHIFVTLQSESMIRKLEDMMISLFR